MVGIIGNTSLTKKVIDFTLSRGEKIKYVFGLPPLELEKKVNGCNLKPLCQEQNIKYIQSNDWDLILNEEVDIVYEMGDSRVVPPRFVNKYYVVGNHGAILPLVQGGASLVWGRMLNNGKWGVSLMRLNEKIDEGDILSVKNLDYCPTSTTMKDFVELCDDATLSCIKENYNNFSTIDNNFSPTIRVPKKKDSHEVVKILKFSLDNNISVYLPPRSPEESILKKEWSADFSESFKIANDYPYPKYIT